MSKISINQALSPEFLAGNAQKGMDFLDKLSKKMESTQKKFEQLGVPLQGLFEAQFQILGLASETLSGVNKELTDSTSELSKLLTTAQSGLAIFGNLKATFNNPESDTFDKVSGSFSAASQTMDLGASWLMEDEDYEEYLKKRNAAMVEANQTSLANNAQFFNKMADVSAQYLGKQNIVYKSMFALSKAFAVANATLNFNSAILQAFADSSALTVAQKFANYAAVASTGAALVSSIKSATMSGMAHSGIDYIPKEGTWLLDEGERVLSPRQNADFTSFIKNGNNNGVQIVINNQAGADVTATYDEKEEIVNIAVNRAVREVSEQLSSGTGSTSRALRDRWNTHTKVN